MVTLAHAPVLIRRLAAALALLAMLALGVHEAAHAAAAPVQDGQSSALAGQLQLQAGPDDNAGGGPDRHLGAVVHSCHVCGTVMPTYRAGAAVFIPLVIVAIPGSVAEHRGLDPVGPHRPPRASLIA
jgi:hypothetical protein